MQQCQIRPTNYGTILSQQVDQSSLPIHQIGSLEFEVAHLLHYEYHRPTEKKKKEKAYHIVHPKRNDQQNAATCERVGSIIAVENQNLATSRSSRRLQCNPRKRHSNTATLHITQEKYILFEEMIDSN